MKVKKQLSNLLIVAALVFLEGCATSIPPEVIATADYGPPPPANYQQMIKDDFAQVLIDPTSPLYSFGSPAKGYTREAPMFGTHQAFGWRVCGTVNSKNRMGGYTGQVPFFVLFRDGQIVSRTIGEVELTGPSLENAAIMDACQRTVS